MERRFTYDCVIVKEDDGYCVSFPQIPEAYTDGQTREEAMRKAEEVLMLCMGDYVDGPEEPPAYERSAEVVTLSVLVTSEDVAEMECFTFKDAAEHLGVSPSRITALVQSEVLEVRLVKGRRMITIESVERYRIAERKPGRPRKFEVVEA